MPSLLEAERFSMPEAAGKLAVHVSTVWRWVLQGVNGRKLPTIRIGKRRYVLREELESFLWASQEGWALNTPAPSQAAKRHQDIETELQKEGL